MVLHERVVSESIVPPTPTELPPPIEPLPQEVLIKKEKDARVISAPVEDAIHDETEQPDVVSASDSEVIEPNIKQPDIIELQVAETETLADSVETDVPVITLESTPHEIQFSVEDEIIPEAITTAEELATYEEEPIQFVVETEQAIEFKTMVQEIIRFPPEAEPQLETISEELFVELAAVLVEVADFDGSYEDLSEELQEQILTIVTEIATRHGLDINESQQLLLIQAFIEIYSAERLDSISHELGTYEKQNVQVFQKRKDYRQTLFGALLGPIVVKFCTQVTA